jgi:LysM repeat protein
MNNPNPFIPQGSILERQSKRRSRVKLAVFCVIAVNVAGLMALLMQGCKREQPPTAENSFPPIETNPPPIVETNPPPMETSSAPAVPLPPPVTSNPPPVTPVPLVAPAPPPTTSGTQYTVVRGDTFSGIAKKFGVSVRAIEDANPNVQPTRLQIGQTLTIPAASGNAAPSAIESAPGSASMTGGGTIYTVKSGDSLTRIARHYGTTVKAIESENNLMTTRIKVGQKLKIPGNAETAPTPAPIAPAPAAPVAPTSAPDGQQ